jgi:apolipoprotein D and lipocalin family protein
MYIQITRLVLIAILGLASFSILGVASMKNAKAGEVDTPIDLERYMGRWYVIANIPYFPERGKVATYDEYILREDGRIDNIYGFKKSFDKKEKQWKALATVTPDTGNRKWTIKFFGMLNADYQILEVAPDYSWVLIGHPKREMGWIMAREAKMEASQYDELLKKFENYDYKTSAFKRIPQFKDQVGKPGFQ